MPDDIDTTTDRLVTAYIAEHGRTPTPATILKLRQQATLETRPDKRQHSLADLTAAGAPALARDEAWEQYTLSFAYGYFLWVITRISSREVVLVHIPRLAAALTDHDTFRGLGVV